MKKFKFTILNEDYSLHKSVILANNVSDAYALWVSQYGDDPFIGTLNINTM